MKPKNLYIDMIEKLAETLPDLPTPSRVMFRISTRLDELLHPLLQAVTRK